MAINTSWGLDPVKRRSTTDQVLQEIRAAILAGRIGPNEQLPEAALARTFGTGRSAIREALRQLVQEGLVVSELNRGAHVRSISRADVLDVFLARQAIEVAAVQRAIERQEWLELTELRSAQERILAASSADVAQPPCPELIAADLDFHRAMVALAGSPRLSRAHEPLAAESQMLLNWHPLYSGSDYAGDHQILLTAIESRDPNVADVTRDHLIMSAELIVQETKRYADRLASADRLVDSDGSPPDANLRTEN
ncbi:MAG TPA: GntR family transcriptional regulator [Solirubrobacteraceae bacterium]